MSKLSSLFRKEILESNLSRPDWVKQNHRSLNNLWLDKNECSDPEFNKIVMQCVLDIPAEAAFSYPDLDTLYAKVAKFCNTFPENILLTAGSDGAIRTCFDSCIHPGDKVIITRPTFAMYDVYSKIYGANVKWLEYEKSPNKPFLKVEEVIKTIKEFKPKMVCLPNPDSPTGTVFSLLDLQKIIKTAEDNNALMLVDEAYHPLYDISVAPFINRFKNLVVVRSFSKAWGAAGLRVGYAIGNSELISSLHKQRPMYEIGNVSAKVIENLLDYESEMWLSVQRINAGKEFFQIAMLELGLISYPSYGNFVHVKFGKYSEEIHKILREKVYYREDFNETSLRGFSRFSSTTKERFMPIIKCITDVIISSEKKGFSNNENL